MRIARLVLVVATLAALAAAPLSRHGSDWPVYAAGSGPQATDRIQQSGNGNDNDDNDNGDNDNGGGIAEDDILRPLPPRPPTLTPTNQASRVVRAGQTDVLQMTFVEGTVVVTVRPTSPLPQDVTIALGELSPSSVPGTPGPRLEPVVFNLTADSGGALPGEATLSISYVDPGGLNEGSLTIAVYDGSQWVPSPGQAPDPINNTVSATITRTGTYTVYQR